MGRRKEGQLYEKSLEMRHFRVCPYQEEVELAPFWAAGVARNGQMRKTPNEENSSDWRCLDVYLIAAKKPNRKF
jgi:hypothetical protein